MPTNQKVVWAEGIYLGQQHFQLWEKWRDEIIQLQLKALLPYSYGFINFVIDDKALAFNKFNLLNCEAIFPNGVYFYYSADEHCLSIDLDHRIKEVYIAISSNDYVSAINGYEQRPVLSRWDGCYEEFVDEYDHERKREILIAKLKPVLLTNLDVLDAYYYLKIAEIDITDMASIKNTYIPSCVRIAASSQLKRLIFNIKNSIRSKLSELTCSQSDMEKVIGAKLRGLTVLLSHYYENDQQHPYQLYKDCVVYLGELFQLADLELNENFSYRHNDCGEVFDYINYMIDRLIQQLCSNKNIIKFSSYDNYKHVIEEFEGCSNPNQSLYLNIDSDNVENLEQHQLLSQVKVATLSTIDTVISSALAGIPLSLAEDMHLLPATKGIYLKLDLDYENWKLISLERNIVIYLPTGIKDLNIKLIIMD